MKSKIVLIGKLLSQIYKRCGYILVITMVLAAPAKILAADNLSAATSVLQQITVTGVVTDEQGEPLPGATVMVKGTTIAAISNLEGRFNISVPDEEAVLVVSFVGYLTQEIEVGSQRVINVTLLEDASQIGEVVVVGYGTQRKETLTGSVASIQSAELVATKSSNVQNMLTGKLPGVRNIQQTSEPGTFDNHFDIRGMGQPLIVIDGVPRGDLPRMDPNDIESISVLKDASAAVYGMQAANGVILITTKSGERGKAKIEYSGYYGIQVPAEILKPINARERAIIFNEISMRNRNNPTIVYDEEYFRLLESGEMPDNDWYGAIMRNTAPQQQHNVSVSGGADKIDYFVNLGYTDQGGFWVTNSSNYNRYNLRTNVNAQINDRLKASVRLNMIMDETNRQREDAWVIFSQLWRTPPTTPLYANDTEPYYYMPDQVRNSLALINPDLTGFLKNKRNIFQSNLSLEYDVPYIAGLKATFMFSYDRTFNDNTNFRKEYAEYRFNDASQMFEPLIRNSPTELTRAYDSGHTSMWNFRLNYNNTFAAVHNLGLLLLYEERYSQSYGFSARRQFEIPIPWLFAGISDTAEADGGGLNESANRAVVGRLNYDYAGKYISEFSFRYDGSSRFPKGHQWGFFPSVQLGYRISEESFIKDNFDFVHNLKIRGTWGILGDDGAAAFQFIEGFNYPATGGDRFGRPNGYIFGNTFVNGLGFRDAPNPELTWYTATMKNIGIDADFLRGMVGFSVDLFQRDRDGLLATPAAVIPGTFGSGISQANLNADRTKGLEVEIRHNYKVGDLRYNVSGFVQITRNMWTKRLQPDRQNSYDYWRNNLVDRYNDIWFGKASDGVYQSWEEIINCPFANANTLPGDPRYLDWNGDGTIDDNDNHPIATVSSNDANRLPTDNTWDGRNYPLMNFGFTLSGQWKAFDFNLLFQGAAMSWVGYGEALLSPLLWDGNALDRHLDRWRPADPNAHPWDPNNEWVSGYYPYGRTRAEAHSAFNMQKGNYLRLKSAEIGFTVPQNNVFDRLKIQRMRIYVNAYNLLTITGVKGVDPEKPMEFNGYKYPLNRTFNFGGSLSF